MNFSSIPAVQSELIRTYAASRATAPSADESRVSPENFAIIRAAATPLPETSPSAIAERLGEGTKS